MRIVIFLLFTGTLAAQLPDATFSIDSTAPASWYFTTTTTTTLETGDQAVQGYRRFFDNKDGVLAYANLVLAAVQTDSVLARRNLVAADSAKYRVGRAIYGWDNTFSGARTVQGPPGVSPQKQPAIETKATKPRTKRVKNLKSKQ